MNQQTLSRAALLAGVVLTVGACNRSQSSLSTVHATAIEDSVRTALEDFRRYAGAGNWDSLGRLTVPAFAFRGSRGEGR